MTRTIKERNQTAKIAHIAKGKYQNKRTVVTLMQRKLMLHTSDLIRRQSFYQRQNKSTQESTVVCLSWK